MYIAEKISEIQKIINYFENSLGNGSKEDLEQLEKLEDLIGENPLLIKYKSIMLYNTGFSQEAVECLDLYLKKHECSYELHELKYEFLKYSDDFISIFYSLAQMFKLAPSEEHRENVGDIIEKYIIDSRLSEDEFKKYFEYFQQEAMSEDHRFYPVDKYGKSMIREDVFSGRDAKNSYLVNMYKSINIADITGEDMFYHLFETIKGEFVKKRANIEVEKGEVFAISSASKESVYTNLTIHNLEKAPILLKLEGNVIKYFRAKNSRNIEITSDQDIFVSLFKKKQVVSKAKLVLQIFVDGLSFQFLKENDFERLMPNTFKFFQKGYINSNCYANGEWTLPSLMSMCTGKYTTSHHVYDTNTPHNGEGCSKFIQEYFEEAGYMTGRICGNWRGTPSYGYFKGTNRSIYSPMHERMIVGEVITETLEHLEAFKDYPNYLWVTIEDLHSVADGLIRGVFQEINIENYLDDNVENDSEISVFRTYNKKKIEEYKSTMKKVDFYLGILFTYIEKSYKENDFIITLNSDHGQKFIEKEDYMFTKRRSNVPLMMRGYKVPNQTSDEIVSNVDVLPTLLELCGLSCDSKMDGKVFKDFGGQGREYSITESIFPGQTYKIAINDKSHLFMFESKEIVKGDGGIPIAQYDLKLKNKLTSEDETNIYPKKVEKYIKVVYEHIKEFISI